jgi:hypothetical protein
MVRSLRERLGDLGSRPELIKSVLLFEDIDRYGLPPDFTKTTDTRRSSFIAKWGDVWVELDALPIEVLRARIVAEFEARMDLGALAGRKRKSASFWSRRWRRRHDERWRQMQQTTAARQAVKTAS